ncbi:LytR C-terminal domain-containing protein [Nocardioides sp.]|uniref:LytR C-terminal domain-containing protein n=1 Tax=Nocardioides sp. TaxID=35761 RepID=UPI002D80E937|nr:LytR C-terminal domain-containing protein [Nocardioides sp.]HET8959695.1 LytR C-terminal domain-containing protein [Nocardioides sp.]
MQQAARTSSILAGLAAVTALGALWGWSAMTEPFPGKTTPPKCVATIVSPGEKLFPAQVTVSVLNASERDGLAGRTMAELVDAGFAEGDTGNAPRDVRVARAAVWAPTPPGPDARLVASRLGPSTRVVDREGPGVGVTVVVGSEYTELVKGLPSVRVRSETEICSPPVA